jgi:hypothetical protein
MLATLRPDSVDFPLLLHVLGAMLLVGAIATVTLLVLASWRRIPEQSALLRRLAFGTMLVVAWPSYILMRLAAQWVLSKEPTVEDADPGWLGVGFIVADAGVLVLVAGGDDALRESHAQAGLELLELDAGADPAEAVARAWELLAGRGLVLGG